MTPKVFNAAAQASPVAATESDSKAICSSLKAKSFGFSVPDQRAFHRPCNARSSRTDKENRSRVCFRLELGVAAPARGFTHAVPPRRLPLTAANSRPKQG
jgi:hypothetical protein